MRFGTLALALLLGLGVSRTNAQSIVYNDTTTFSGFAYANGGATVQAGNNITTMVADDITFASGFAGQQITGFTFSVANLNTVAVTARARVRFYTYDSTTGAPTTYLTGFSFNPIAFATGVGLVTYNPGVNLFAIPTNNTIWAGITFDNNTGTTGITTAQLNNLGQGIYSPPTVGSSQDAFFKTTAAGSFLQNSPAGSYLYFGGSPAANFGWSFTAVTPAANPPAVPEPSTLALLIGMGVTGTTFLRRRKSA